MRTIRFSLLCFILFLTQNVLAQQPVTLSIFNESTAIPYDRLFSTPIHPGVQIGTEFNWKESRHFRLYPSISVGYMFHRKLFQGLYANLELGFDYKTSFGLNLKSKIGLGYLRTFSTQQEFQFEDGEYKSRSDKGNSRLMPSFTTGLGYRLNQKENNSSEIYILYQSWLEYPYSPGFIPLMAHTNLHLGLRFYPFEKNEQ